jgi:hypothetical protein
VETGRIKQPKKAPKATRTLESKQKPKNLDFWTEVGEKWDLFGRK